MKKSIITLILSLFFLHPLFSQQSIDGSWKGNISVIGKQLEIFTKFTTEPDSVRGTISIPVQNAIDLKLIKVSFNSPKVYFELPAGKSVAVFDGAFSNDSIKGDFMQSGITGNFYLVRYEKTEEELPYKEEEVTFMNGDIKFAGTLTIPKLEGKHPAVVMITGSGPHNRDEDLFGFKIFRIIADNFTRKGIAVLRYDDRDMGGSTGKPKSESTTDDFAGDVLQAVKYLQTRNDINPKEIGLCGHSEGGIIAPMVASKSDDVAFIVLMAGTSVRGIDLIKEQSKMIILSSGGTKDDVYENNLILDQAYNYIKTGVGEKQLKKMMMEGIENGYNKMSDEEKSKIKNKDEYIKNTCNMQLEEYKSPWMKYFVQYDPIPALEKVKCPVLALFGEKDLQVPPAQNKEPMENVLRKGSNTDYSIVLIPKANHLFQEAKTGNPDEYSTLPKEFAPGFLDTMSDWIVKHVDIVK